MLSIQLAELCSIECQVSKNVYGLYVLVLECEFIQQFGVVPKMVYGEDDLRML